MTALTLSRIVMLCSTMIAPIAVVIACAAPADSDDDLCEDDLQTSSQNCGECGRACVPGQFCQGGECACTPPYQACGIECRNLQGDPASCGTCGTACPASAPFCSMGACSTTCALTTCGSFCVDPTTDPRNCGTCGNICGSGQVCQGSVCACPVGQVPCSGGCAASCGTGGSGGSGTGGTTSTGGTTPTGGTSGAGGAPTGGSAGAGAGGSGGMVVQKLCATKTTPAAPTITDFDTYDGMMPAYGTGSWTFTMGPTTAPAYAGLYALSEGFNETTMMPPAAYTLTMAGGANGSAWAARAVNMMTTDWGGGIGMWMGCINASMYSGISFYVRGTSPTSMANIGLAMEDATAPDAANPAGGGTCDPAPTDGCAGPSYAFPLAIDWTLVTVPWAMFTAGRGAAGAAVVPNGDEITGISFGVGINYVENPVGSGTYVPEPGSFEIAIDSLAFTP
jgi:hypothetical protein